MSGIDTLIEKLEAADGPNYAIEVEIFKLVHPEYAGFIQGRGGLIHPQDGEDVRVQSSVRPSNYMSSIDAAVRLGQLIIPNWQLNIVVFSDELGEASIGNREYATDFVFKKNAAHALCIAILKAKRAAEVAA
ncbi:hypothetical protein FLX27_22115 [Agrobacterium tumefaciens]|nr:hypothetical protein [Agrobacterium tumefaciens]TQN59608.1 hypothetical protein FLX27_22115 [Agrobacterium tumefaciens]